MTGLAVTNCNAEGKDTAQDIFRLCVLDDSINFSSFLVWGWKTTRTCSLYSAIWQSRSTVWTHLGVTRFAPNTHLVWWSKNRHSHPLGCIFSAELWLGMVLVSMERTQAFNKCDAFYAGELRTRMDVSWFCRGIYRRVFQSWQVGRAVQSIRS